MAAAALDNTDGSSLTIACDSHRWTYIVHDRGLYDHSEPGEVLLRFNDEKADKWQFDLVQGAAGVVYDPKATLDAMLKDKSVSADQVLTHVTAGYLDFRFRQPTAKRLRLRIDAIDGSKDFDFDITGVRDAMLSLGKACNLPVA